MNDNKSYTDAKQAFLELAKQNSSTESIIKKTPKFKSVGLKSVNFNHDSQLRNIQVGRLDKQNSNEDKE